MVQRYDNDDEENPIKKKKKVEEKVEEKIEEKIEEVKEVEEVENQEGKIPMIPNYLDLIIGELIAICLLLERQQGK